MSFTIRQAKINDALALFDMIKEYHIEVNLLNKPFSNTRDNFIKTVFGDKTNIFFLIAEYQNNILAYCAYTYNYEVLFGASLNIKEIFVKKEYRKLGVFIFIVAKIIDIAAEQECYLIKWVTDLNNERINKVKEKFGVTINKEEWLLNIHKENIKKYLDKHKGIGGKEVRFVKTYELPDVFSCMETLANDNNIKQKIDLYKLISDGYTTNPKFKIMIVVEHNEIVGFLSFSESYGTSEGKVLILDVYFVKDNYRDKSYGSSLFIKFYQFAFDNDYTNVETRIDKSKTEKLDKLKEFDIFPFKDLRCANFIKEEYIKLLNY